MRGIIEKIRRWERSFHESFQGEIASEADRRRTERYVAWIDHGILRALWHNYHEVAPGVFRSNHPDRKRLERYAALGIRRVLTFRGNLLKPFHRLEQQACEELGLELTVISMASREAPSRASLLALLDYFDTSPRPFLMHCKSGADRTSLAGAIYLLHAEGASLAEARKQMSPRYLHFRWTETGVLDRVLDLYEARLAEGPTTFREWVEADYDPEAVAESFARSRRHL
jgi:protein tyrosine phosphatase (PTP) superfamily phosphohydrolase (DUF442 family)